MAILKINGVDMPSPSVMKVNLFDVSSAAERNACGEAVIDRVGTKRRLEIKWAYLSAQDMQRLLAAVGGDTFFEAVYPDPMAGDMRSMTCYCGDRSTGILRMQNGAPVWTDIEMNWIER